jgi:hypothetical protein
MKRLMAGQRIPATSNIRGLPSPPVAIATQVTGQVFKRGGVAQINTDLSGRGMKLDSERVKFSDMVAVAIGFDSTPHLQLPFNAGSGTYVGAIPISPSQLSSRLQLIEETYGFFAFRELVFTYVPYVGTSTAGGIGFAYDMSYDEAASMGATTGIPLTSVLQHEESVLAPVYECSKVSFKFTGSRLWSCTNVASPTDVLTDFFQGVLWACGTNNVSASTNYGRLLVSGVIDFYKQVEVTTSPSLRIQRIWDNYLLKEWLSFRLQTGAEAIPFKDFCTRYGEPIKSREMALIKKRASPPLLLYEVDRRISEEKS